VPAILVVAYGTYNSTASYKTLQKADQIDSTVKRILKKYCQSKSDKFGPFLGNPHLSTNNAFKHHKVHKAVGIMFPKQQ